MIQLAIKTPFLEELRNQRNLSKEAFARACGVTNERLAELEAGSPPTMLEFANIQLGFNRNESGIPMVAITNLSSGNKHEKHPAPADAA